MLDHRISNMLIEMEFGSYLYGTSTPMSDHDYKGVFSPSPEVILLDRVPKSIRRDEKTSTGDKNTTSDVDRELYSLNYFIKLACEGQTVALDMLHADERHWTIEPHPAWLDLVAKRSKFYTRDLKSFVEYARRQAAKYGLKGSRLADAKTVLGILNAIESLREKHGNYGSGRTEMVWPDLPNLENARHLDKIGPNGERQYDVCGIILQDTAPLYISIKPVENFVTKFGERARQAKRNEGVDWKALSHAFRAAYQVRSVLLHGSYKYPLVETPHILAIKHGEVNAVDCLRDLDSLISIVENLADNSDLPEQADTEYWDRWLLEWLPKTTGLIPAVTRSYNDPLYMKRELEWELDL